MSRPLYQTPAHVANEARLAGVFGLWLGSGGVKLHPLDHADRSYLFGKLYAEMKCRTCSRHEYGTYSVSATKKVNAARLGRPTILVVEWTDGVGVLSIHKPDYYEMGGRRDRGDPRDIELMAHYDVERFRMIR